MDPFNFQQHRRAIGTGLARSNRSILVNSLLIVGLALLAIWIARLAQRHADTVEVKAEEALAAEGQVRQRLWDAYLAQARVERLSREAGRKRRGLEAIAAAAAIRPAPELVDEAVATLAMYDIGEELVFHAGLPINFEAAFSGDFRHYLMYQGTNHLSLNNAETGETIRQFELDAPYFAGARFSPDDRFVSAYDGSGAWYFWRPRDPDWVRKIAFRTYARSAMRPAFRPGSDLIALCGPDRSVQFFDLNSDFKRRLEFDVQPNRVEFSPDGQRLVVATDATLRVLDWDSLRIERSRDFAARINEVHWSPGGEELVLALENGEVVQYDPASEASVVMRGHSAYANDAFYHPDGNLIVSHSWDLTTRFWDAGNGQLLFMTSDALAYQFDATGTRLAFARETAGVGIWAFERPVGIRQFLAPLKAMNSLKWVDAHPTRPWIVVCRADEFLIWDYEADALLLRKPFDRTFSAVFDGTGERLFVTGYGGLAVYRLGFDGGKAELESLPLQPPLQAAAYLERSALAADGKAFVVGGYNQGYVMNPETLELEFQFGEGLGALAYTAISPDRRWLLATSWKRAGTCLWDLTAGKQVGVLTRHASAAEFSPDGTTLATCNNRGLQLWETGTWQRRHQIVQSSPGYGPGPVRFTPDGRFVATALLLPTISFFDARSGEPKLQLNNPNRRNNAHLTFSRDGTKLFSATQDRTVHLWDLAVLQRRMDAMSLPWPLTTPANAADSVTGGGLRPGAHEDMRPSLATGSLNLIIGLIVSGMLLAIFFGAYTLLQQRRLVGGYERVEQLAEEQSRRLLLQEAELQQSQKMQALGTLAAGVAHDFNNLLSVINLSNDFLKRGLKGDPGLEEETQAITRAVQQGRQVVEGMLGYSRSPDASARREFNLCDLVEDAVGLLGQQFLSGIRLTLELDRTAPDLVMARGKVEQILLNLIINASDAMSGRGKLLIRVWPARRDQVSARVLTPPPEAVQFLVLEVSDNGCGIPPELMQRIFEPFFTTKNVGARQGTGLGLSTIYTIAEHEGFGLDVESVVGQGTTFRTLIPVNPARQTPSDSAGSAT